MNASTTAAVALTEQVERLGSYFGFAAVIGLGVLSMLYFAQAREVKRLREWAGRSPERDAELAQRVQSDAQRRVVAQPVAQPRPAAQPGSPQTAAAQQADAARKAAAAALLAQAQQAGPLVGPPGQLDRPAAAAAAPPPATANTAEPSTAGTAPPPAPGSVPPGAAPPAAPGTGAPPAAVPAVPGQPAAPATVAGANALSTPAPTAATAGAAAAAARQAGPPARTPAFTNGSGGQDTHESDAARPEPLPALPRVPRAVTPAAARLSDDDTGSHGGPRLGLVLGGVGGVIAVVIVLVLLLTGGSDTPPKDNEIGGVSPPPAAPAPASSTATKVDRKATQVAVLNGTTQTGLARNVGNKLESSGFTILSVGDNADQQIATTSISYVDGSDRAARVVAQIMDVPSTAVQPIDLNTSAAVDPAAKVVVVVGSDRSNTG